MGCIGMPIWGWLTVVTPTSPPLVIGTYTGDIDRVVVRSSRDLRIGLEVGPIEGQSGWVPEWQAVRQVTVVRFCQRR
jgi:hypothetical protein